MVSRTWKRWTGIAAVVVSLAAAVPADARSRIGSRVGHEAGDDVGNDVAIGVGITTGVLALVGAAVWYYWRHRHDAEPSSATADADNEVIGGR